ncbi:MAG: hypothetical protein ACYDD1_06955 [Caulobacteraceae bacterium]
MIVGLQETLRVIVVDWILVDGWRNLHWAYVLTNRGPNAIMAFYQGAAAVVIARNFRRSWSLGALAAILVASCFGYFALLPVLKALAVATQTTLRLAKPPELYQMPYGLNVYTYIYGMFIEPTIAALVMAALAWPRLGASAP